MKQEIDFLKNRVTEYKNEIRALRKKLDDRDIPLPQPMNYAFQLALADKAEAFLNGLEVKDAKRRNNS